MILSAGNGGGCARTLGFSMLRLVPILAIVLAVPYAGQALFAGVPDFAQLSREAEAARESGRNNEAIALYRRSLHMRPAWQQGWWHLGTLLYASGRFTEAATVLRRLTALAPELGPCFGILGLAEFGSHHYDEALRHLERASKLGLEQLPDDVRRLILYHAGLLLTRHHEYDRARKLLTDIPSGPGLPDATPAIGLAALGKPLLPEEIPLASRELYSLAGAAAYAAETHAPQAASLFEELLRKYPQVEGVHYLHGCFLAPQDHEASAQEFRLELEHNPKHVPSLGMLALEHLKRGEAAAATPYARQAVEIAPASYLAHNVLGRCLAESGDLDGGIRELVEAVRLAPANAEAHWTLASVYGRAGREADAERERSFVGRLKQGKTPR